MRSRIGQLDGLRAVSVLMVITVHWVSPYVPLFFGGYIGVDIFFVISGFLITSILMTQSKTDRLTLSQVYVKFMQRRAMRLLPVFIVFVIVGAFIYLVTPGSPAQLKDLFPAALVALTQMSSIWLALQLGKIDPFGHFWSLAVEWYFYALWPFFVFALRGVTNKIKVPIIIGIAITCYFLAWLGNEHYFYYGPFASISMLLIGALTAYLKKDLEEWFFLRTKTLHFLQVASLLTVLIFFVFGPTQFDILWKTYGFPVIGLASGVLVLTATISAPSIVSLFLNSKALQAIGLRSYSLYVWHFLAINTLTRSGPMSMQLKAVIGVLFTVIATELSYRFIETKFSQSTKPYKRSPASPRPGTM
jgi:peptidoglycan/LPS O-acetylase OafA/YrhL